MKNWPQNTFQAFQRKCYELHLQNKRPKLLLHACCGPCSSACLVQLYDYFDITIFFTNSNIAPQKEYDRRLHELEVFLERFNNDYHANIQLVKDAYEPQDYLSKLIPFKENHEGGRRCHLCYEMRMRKALNYATLHHFDYCTTTLTLSRQKNSKVINEIAKRISVDYPEVEYLYSDFKKNSGIDLSWEMSRIYDMYRQDYCGCPFSQNYHE